MPLPIDSQLHNPPRGVSREKLITSRSGFPQIPYLSTLHGAFHRRLE
jgi:hypothetical protein